MRILYYYKSQHFNTGSPKMLVTMVELLDRRRHEPLFLATGDGPLIAELQARDVTIVRRPVRQVAVRSPIRGSWRAAASARWLSRHAIDLLHVNEFGWNFDVVLGAWLAQIPVLLHVHTPLHVYRQNLHRLVARQVLFVSEAHRRETEGLALLGGKDRVLYNAIDVDRYASGRSIRGALGLPEDATVIATVCQLSPRKAVEVLLDVAERLLPRWPGLHFVVAGPPGKGEDAYASVQLDRARSAPLAGRVHFIGSRQDIPDILRSADIFFLPTRHETYGLVVAEAMAASLPVVASNIGGIPEVLTGPSVGSLVPPGDVAGFAAALALFIGSPERRASVGRAARASLDGRFDRPAFARSLEKVYASL